MSSLMDLDSHALAALCLTLDISDLVRIELSSHSLAQRLSQAGVWGNALSEQFHMVCTNEEVGLELGAGFAQSHALS